MPNPTQCSQPWNDSQMQRDLLAVISNLPRVPLLDAARRARRGEPGLYLQFLSTARPVLVDLLTPTVCDARVPLYVGSASSWHQRLRRYSQSLVGLPHIDLSELYVSVLPCTTRASALFAEATLLDTPGVCGVMNRIGGWGSKIPGARRTAQTASPVDALFAPGRGWVRPPSLVDQIRARCQVLAYLAELDPNGYRWPALQARP